MSINLNDAKEQGSPSCTIPPKSKVLVRLEIQYPVSGRQGDVPECTRSRNSAMQYLSTILRVVDGNFQGAKIYHNFNVAGAATEGQHKAVDISMRQLRAFVESARGVQPKDNSPQAVQNRLLQSWSELNGMEAPVLVDCEESTPNAEGKTFINNSLKAVITMDDNDYQTVKFQHDIISTLPIPARKNGPDATQYSDRAGTTLGTQPSNGAAPWNTRQQGNTRQQASTGTPSTAAGAPAWAQPRSGAVPPPPASTGAPADDIPF